jgi:hypothetical protein
MRPHEGPGPRCRSYLSNVSTNTRKKKGRTYLWDLDISHGDFSDDDEKR